MASTPRWLQLLPWLTAALPFMCIAASGFPAGDDWQLELTRVAQYLEALRDGQWPPFWAPSLYAGHGSPVFLFYGHAFLALASLGALAAGSCGLGFVLGLLAASAFAVPLTQRLGARLVQAAPDDAARAGRITAYLYLASPYLLADLLLRNAAAEYVALCFLPLLLCGVPWAVEERRRAWLQLALGVALVCVSHVLVAIMACVLLVPVGLARMRARPADGLGLVCGGALGLGLAAFHVLPIAAYRSLLHGSELLQGKFAYGAQLGSLTAVFDPRLSHAAGALPLALAACAALRVLSRRREQRERAAATGCSTSLALLAGVSVCALLQTPLARPCLGLVPDLAYLQFPFRWNGPLALGSALLAALLLTQLMAAWTSRRKLLLELGVWLACLLAAWPQLVRMHTQSWQELARFGALLAPESMRRALFTATVGDEYLPPGVRRTAVRGPAQLEPVLSAGTGTKLALRSIEPRQLSLMLRADQPVELCLARWGFPFWQVRVDDHVQAATRCADGHLRVRVPAGKHSVEVSLPVPPMRRLGLWISCALGILIAVGALLESRTRARARTRSEP